MQKLTSQHNNNKDSFLLRLFKGEVDLWVTFWVFGFGISMLYRLIATLLIVNAQAILDVSGRALFVVVVVFGLIYQPFIWIAIWRSANKYKGLRVWSFLAQLMVVVGIVNTLLEIFATRQ